ncbi:T9SS type A sorting domain-containing protein [Hyunsoonleella flava]|uniref:T9SS type A sorting domain-containing protein n=1 Tax=Hyunsoonleella flava TaxID=2527939 RepID=A0A4Q9FDT7_9FLAO|nr:LamG-like jellyroll fold domain-containing protein [Hyunsoonleella flava]TBN00381.1 T9SS type A sorting domain-containing protein [Hyunsoonleella flava]
MKTIRFSTILVILLLLYVEKTFGQLHAPPSCGENFTLDWASVPSASNEYNWTPGGALTNTFTNVDNSGINFTVTFTGETGTLGSWGGQTPKVGTAASGGSTENLDLYTTGFSSTGITCTITFSSPIYALSFDLLHVNAGGGHGDMYTINATTTSGGTIYPTFTNSGTPSYTSNNATGVVDANASSTSGTNAMVGVNFYDPDYITSVTFLWQDCSTCSPFRVHGSGLGNFSFCIPQTLDFDGVNDYISRSAFLGGESEVTMMTWFKMDSGSDGGEIMGQRNFRLYVDASKRLKGYLKTSTALDIYSPDIPAALLTDDLWYHAALKFSSTSGTFELFLNGTSIFNYTNPSLVGISIINTSGWNSDHDFEIGRNTFNDNNYFEGSIYECRVYDKALTTAQLHRQINQEIENNSGNVRGTVIPKDIEGLSWSDLILYYKMDVIDTGYTPDDSNSNVDGQLHNMRTYQEYTAPLPYVTTTSCSGDWNNSSNWEHGDVWDIHSTPPDCAIVQIQGNIEVDQNTTTVGMIVDSGASIDVKDDSGLFNSWYLKLDGKIDLEGEAQLVQNEDSTLDPTSSGTLQKDQQGTADTFTYNYWSSPVGRTNNSTNNNAYNVTDVFTNTNFLSTGYNGTVSPLGIADYWIWKFSNRLSDDYASWQHVRQSGMLQVGEGFTMKGPGSGGITDDQNYVLEGKPNNGDIDLTISAGNDYLVGNPYPSAIDAEQFILDNGATIAGTGSTTGTLYFWEHWGGGSHIADQYQGGYATYSLAGGVPAAAIGTTDPDVASGGTPTKIPGRYIPVGQGFFVTAETGGTIRFNNGQRVFQVEDGSNSLFVKSNNSKKLGKDIVSKNEDTRMKLRLGFNSTNTLRRQLLVTVDQNATNGVDWGYDSKYIDTQMDDMYWIIDNEKFVIQAIDTITSESIIPLGIHVNKAGLNSITIDKLENVADNLDIYLHDKELDLYHDLRASKYEINLPAGEHLNRFEITFSKSQTLSNGDFEIVKLIDVFYSNEKESIIIDNPKSHLVQNVEMFNILGQSLFRLQPNSSNKNIEYKVPRNIAGNYVLNIETEHGKISKKVLIK